MLCLMLQKCCISISNIHSESCIFIRTPFDYVIFSAQANNMVPDTAAKQVSQFTKVISHVYDMVNKAREDWDVESGRAGIQTTSSVSDTHALVAAIGMGKGLVETGASMVPPVRPTMPVGPAAPPTSTIGKAPSGIKTNIKSANQIHPYSR